MHIIEAHGVRFLRSPLLAAFEGLTHAFFTRIGGVSQGVNSSLNFDMRGGDTQENITENKRRAGRAIGTGIEALYTVNQVHGNTVADWSAARDRTPDADAIINATPGIPVGIMTADCMSALLYDPENKKIAAVHAGWKGSASGVITKTVEEMGRRYGTKPADIRAALGPCIKPCCYKVQADVYEEFKKNFENPLDFFKREEDGFSLDLTGANRGALLAIGVSEKHIDATDACTCCDKENFFSYRRDNGQTGRMLSVIILKD